MKKILLLAACAGAPTAAFAAGCEYFSGYGEADTYVFYAQDSDSCPSGYTETTAIKIVDNNASCPSGWIEAPAIKEVVCDSSKGVCSTGYTCPGQ
ncbi:MAG: hypothetical protein LBL21_04110 [Rickettsiales bacterium]|jgi:hypothetical protein|nr:hypothetical protein [Rickettsiales bacterium]